MTTQHDVYAQRRDLLHKRGGIFLYVVSSVLIAGSFVVQVLYPSAMSETPPSLLLLIPGVVLQAPAYSLHPETTATKRSFWSGLLIGAVAAAIITVVRSS